MTADTFTILLDNLFVEKVFKHEVHREVFLAYSQVVPEGVKNFDDIIFVIFFMTPEAPIQIVQDKMRLETREAKLEIVWAALITFIITALLIMLIVICITRKIIRAIIKLNCFSMDMKQACDKESRKEIIKEIGSDPLFRGVARQYEAYQIVKQFNKNKIYIETDIEGEGSDSELDDDPLEHVEQRLGKIED